MHRKGGGKGESKGEGVQQGHKSAVQWHTKAAEQGNANAQLNLGTKHATGEGVQRDYLRSYMW